MGAGPRLGTDPEPLTPFSRFSGCLHTTLRGSLQERVLAATFGSSEVPALETILPALRQAADCYRALLSLSGLNGRGPQKLTIAPVPQHCCKASNSSQVRDRQRSHHVPVSAGQ